MKKNYKLKKITIYSIKYFLKQLKKSIKVDLICLTIENNVVWASSEWLNINIIDIILFLMTSEIYCENNFHELTIYFTKT